jgi:predicted AAA+ superfamily ATPase
MFTLGFSEYLDMKRFLRLELGPDAQEFEQWLAFGGFPRALRIADPSAKDDYVRDVVDQVFEKDIRARRKIRNRIAFERSMAYAINNFGATTNLTNITGYLDNVEHVTVKKQTLAGYLELLSNAKLLYKCPRFDLKSRRSLRGEEKYYLADAGIYFARNVDTTPNYGPLLENVTYTYLRSRGYGVSARIGPLSSRIQCLCATFVSAARAPRYARCLPRNSSITSQGMTSTSS